MKIQRLFNINDIIDILCAKKTLDNVDEWTSKIRALSKAITFIENDPLLALKFLSDEVFNQLKSKAHVIGLTGLPGAGKSSLTNLIVTALRQQNYKVAVLAVDPSQQETGGAVLGDRIRMQEHFTDKNVFIRSMGSRGALGGVSHATRGALRLIGMLDFDYILVETVGVGQSECEIVGIADTTCLVLMPDSGDEIQLMKSGILQMADIYIINKIDLKNHEKMSIELQTNVANNTPGMWSAPVIGTSTYENKGIVDLITNIQKHEIWIKTHEYGLNRKLSKLKTEVIANMLFLAEPLFKEAVNKLNIEAYNKILNGQKASILLAQEILTSFIK